jgi:NAD-dependent dihydropyrimidine dehydrogenase PreA subunit
LINETRAGGGFLRRGTEVMPYVIAEPCIGTKDSACVDVCPVDCIHPRKDESEFDSVIQLYIHPDECIDCGACEPACPVQAIFPSEDDVPADWKHHTEKNSDYYVLSGEEFQGKWGSPGRMAG